MHSLIRDHVNNNAWYRQMAAGWARRMITGDSPGAWAHNTEKEVQFAITELQLRPGDKLLDLGCGWGRHSLPLASYGLQVTGIDLSHDLLAMAQYNAVRHGLAVNWVEGDIAQMPLRGSFDAITQFCGNFMTWLSSRNETMAVLEDLATLLRPGGRLLFGTDTWRSELPPRSQQWDEWKGGAAIYRQKFDAEQRVTHMQTVVFGPEHERHEYNRQTWYPHRLEMEIMFAQAGLTVYERFNTYADGGFEPNQDGLIFVLKRDSE